LHSPQITFPPLEARIMQPHFGQTYFLKLCLVFGGSVAPCAPFSGSPSSISPPSPSGASVGVIVAFGGECRSLVTTNTLLSAFSSTCKKKKAAPADRPELPIERSPLIASFPSPQGGCSPQSTGSQGDCGIPERSEDMPQKLLYCR